MEAVEKKKLWTKRLIIYLFGVIIMSFGISLTILAQIGVAPASSIPYALSKLTVLSVGWCTTLFHVACILVQMIILRRVTVKHVLQFPLTFVVGRLIDLFLWLIPRTPGTLPGKIILLLVGIIFLAFGIRTVVGADLLLLPSDSLARLVGEIKVWTLAKSKVMFDITFPVIAVAIMLAARANVFSVIGIGTIICAATTGPAIAFFTRWVPIEKKLPSADNKTS